MRCKQITVRKYQSWLKLSHSITNETFHLACITVTKICPTANKTPHLYKDVFTIISICWCRLPDLKWKQQKCHCLWQEALKSYGHFLVNSSIDIVLGKGHLRQHRTRDDFPFSCYIAVHFLGEVESAFAFFLMLSVKQKIIVVFPLTH